MFTYLYRRSSLFHLLYLTVACGLLLTGYYLQYTHRKTVQRKAYTHNYNYSNSEHVDCPVIYETTADIDTIEIFPQLEFQPKWLNEHSFWTDFFDARLRDLNRNNKKMPLKVILVPFSHNDPGWLETFEYYMQQKSGNILNNVIDKLSSDETSTFVWSEVAFLERWWKTARIERKISLRRLVMEGRIEILTGAWVMADEATTHIYALVDQIIEGHQWVKKYLHVQPQYGWSLDVFGHGSTVPHLLSLSGLNGTIVQRLHYAWKYWLAYQRSGDFEWKTNFPSNTSILTHNQPFYLYTVKHSCGPNMGVCYIYNYNSHKPEFVYKSKFVDNLESLIEEYEKSASLFKHKVILVPIGEDFSYVTMEELNGQFEIYNTVIEEVKSRHPEMEVSFGTPKQYFEEIQKRQKIYPTLRGDFFNYADASDLPSYWTGYYTSRPFLKILDRILEAQLRSCEILYTITFNYAIYFSNLKWDYRKIVDARRTLDLFQHHDAITGTSKSFVVKDHITKLTTAIIDTLAVQRNSISVLYGGNISSLISEDNIDVYDDFSTKHVHVVHKGITSHVIIFNSLLQERYEFVKILVSDVNAKIKDNNGKNIPIQISPVYKYIKRLNKLCCIPDKYELSFIAAVPALTVIIYELYYFYNTTVDLATLHTNDYFYQNESDIEFLVSKITASRYIRIENAELSLAFDGKDGFLKKVHKKSTKSNFYTFQTYTAYNSHQDRSGAYIFAPDSNSESDKNVLKNYQAKILVILGNVYSEIAVSYEDFLMQKVRVYNTDSYLSQAIFMESIVNFGSEYQNIDTELVMRIKSSIDSKNVFYTDANGFQTQKRVIVPSIGVEGNYFPVTTMIYIEDQYYRLSLLTDHSLGATSFSSGQIEVMLDRKTLKDDGKGIEEGMTDNRKITNRFILLPERLIPHNLETEDKKMSLPTLLANHLSNSVNYPLNIYANAKAYSSPTTSMFNFISSPYSCNVHLLNLRTHSDRKNDYLPSKNALLILHSQGYSCLVKTNFTCFSKAPHYNVRLNFAIVKSLNPTLLSGLETNEDKIANIGAIRLNMMDLKTYNVSFR